MAVIAMAWQGSPGHLALAGSQGWVHWLPRAPRAGWHWVTRDSRVGLRRRGVGVRARISINPCPPPVLARRAPQELGVEAGMMAPESTGDPKAQGREWWLAGHLASWWEVPTVLHPGVTPTCWAGCPPEPSSAPALPWSQALGGPRGGPQPASTGGGDRVFDGWCSGAGAGRVQGTTLLDPHCPGGSWASMLDLASRGFAPRAECLTGAHSLGQARSAWEGLKAPGPCLLSPPKLWAWFLYLWVWPIPA